MGNLTKNFSADEMRCKCGCDICNVSEDFMDKLQALRTLVGFPLTITSGCRCQAHNKACGGKPTSDHLATENTQCEGVDIKCLNSKHRRIIILTAEIVGIKRAGIAKTFIHLGTKKSNPQKVMWVY